MVFMESAMKKCFIAMLFCLLSVHLSAAPAGWFTEPDQAQEASRSRNLPILVIFAGKECTDSAVLRGKLDAFRNQIEDKCVMLYIELPPASQWGKEFRRKLQRTYPFLAVESGIPLPAIYMTDAKFQDLNIREPRYTAAGFRKMVLNGQEKFAAAKLRTETAPQESAATTVKETPKKTAGRRTRTEAASETDNTAKAVAKKKKIYNSVEQAKEAERQRDDNLDKKADPPTGWFIDKRKAQEFAAARKLPIMILFSGTDWCGPCKSLRRRILDKRNLQNLVTDKCVALYVHVSRKGWNKVRSEYPFWKGRGVPSFIFTDAEFNVVGGDLRDRSYNGISNAIKAATGKLR
ncbi:MAG: thioredoxin family protein [Lentisphaerae bacterium]|nr:thioredoxin family protein [Lentisphaerota bacterium]